ncbi:hypothetical protein YPPY04_2628, partial [Yersinia pestis PY-04]|jgi:hypothetical protein
MRRGR